MGNNMQENVRFDRWWARLVAIFVIVFLGWFILREWEGFKPLAEFIVGAVVEIPNAVQNIITYYSDVSATPLIISLGIGAAFGVITTVYVFAVQRGYILPFQVTRSALGIAFVISAFAAFNKASAGIVLLAFVIPLIVISGLRNKQTRELFRTQTLRALTVNSVRGFMIRGVILGALVGAIGAQVLNTPIRHCAFEPEADITTRWMGYAITLISALVLLVPMWALSLRGDNRKSSSQAGYFKGVTLPLLLLAPTLLSLLVFLYYPSFQIAAQSLLRVRRGRNAEPVFDCLNNYVGLLNDSVYQSSFLTTLLVTVAIVVFIITL
jgi:hypothetical protein